MNLSSKQYRYSSLLIGCLLVIYGGGTILAYLVFLLTGFNSVSKFTNEFGILFMGLMGAFILPTGIAILGSTKNLPTILWIASIGLSINGFFRLSILLVPSILRTAGSTIPVIEFVTFNLLALFALFVRAGGPVQVSKNALKGETD